MDLPIRVFRLQKEHLGNDQIGHLIIDGRAQKDNALLEEPGINVIGPLTPAALLHYNGNQRHAIPSPRPQPRPPGPELFGRGPIRISWFFHPATGAVKRRKAGAPHKAGAPGPLPGPCPRPRAEAPPPPRPRPRW